MSAIPQGTMAHVLSNYAQVCCDGNEQLAQLELSRQLRDRLIYERYVHWPKSSTHLSNPFAQLICKANLCLYPQPPIHPSWCPSAADVNIPERVIICLYQPTWSHS